MTALIATSTTATASNGNDKDKPKEEESTATIEPVVNLEEGAMTSGTEAKETLWQYHAKLFVYGETLLDKGTDTKKWMQHGTGNARILHQWEHGFVQFLMHQEKTMKVISNHALDPSIQLKPSAGSDKG
jgi:Ran-binding protein 1